MDRIMRKSGLLVSLVLLFLVGCDAPDVEIVISPEYQSATIQIDFVRVPRSNLPVWMSKNIDEYFSPGDSFREYAMARGDVYSVYFNVPEREFNELIEGKDEVWERFEFDRGSIDQEFDVVVFVDIPGMHSGSPIDVRRKVIPLQKKSWSISILDKVTGKGLDKLTVSITSSGILLDPAPTDK